MLFNKSINFCLIVNGICGTSWAAAGLFSWNGQGRGCWQFWKGGLGDLVKASY